MAYKTYEETLRKQNANLQRKAERWDKVKTYALKLWGESADTLDTDSKLAKFIEEMLESEKEENKF